MRLVRRSEPLGICLVLTLLVGILNFEIYGSVSLGYGQSGNLVCVSIVVYSVVGEQSSRVIG